MTRLAKAGRLARGRIVPGLFACMAAASMAFASTTSLPKEPDELVEAIRAAIETKDYAAFEELIFWKDVGKIKRRIVRFQINRGLGRPIKSITFEDFPEDGLDQVVATGKLVPNMEMTNRVRVIYDEEPINEEGKLPTSVYLVGKRDDVYRIGLVVRKPGFDDDDD